MASDSSKIEILGRVPLFSRCSKKELKQIAPLVDEVRVSAGRELISEGRGGEEAFVIVSGTASVTTDGTEVRTVGAGDAIGEMALLDPTALRSATVIATSDMELLVIGARAFNSLLLKHPQVTLQIAIGLAERVRDLSPVSD
jgi:CRP/FNR family cyclic AMP-dependent transcriptional regulator